LTYQFDCVFVFALATLSSYTLFLHWQHNSQPYGELASYYECFAFVSGPQAGGAQGGEYPHRKFFVSPGKMCCT